jgi:hypothetical protein
MNPKSQEMLSPVAIPVMTGAMSSPEIIMLFYRITARRSTIKTSRGTAPHPFALDGYFCFDFRFGQFSTAGLPRHFKNPLPKGAVFVYLMVD